MEVGPDSGFGANVETVTSFVSGANPSSFGIRLESSGGLESVGLESVVV